MIMLSCLGAFAIGVAACLVMGALPFIVFAIVGIGVGLAVALVQGSALGGALLFALALLFAVEAGFAAGLLVKLAAAPILEKRRGPARGAMGSPSGTGERQAQTRP